MLFLLSPEELIPSDHPIRRIRRVIDEILAELDGEFDVARTLPSNAASRRVLEKAGFTIVSTTENKRVYERHA